MRSVTLWSVFNRITLVVGSLFLGADIARAAWLPSDFDNLAVWFDAADPDGDGVAGGSLVTGGVATWVDKAGSFDVTQSTASNQPSLASYVDAFNGLPVVHFDGTSDFLQNTSVSYSARTVFAVYRVTEELRSNDLGSLWGDYDAGHVAPDGRDEGYWSFDGGVGAQAYYAVDYEDLVSGGGGSKTQPWIRDDVQMVTVRFTSTRSLNKHFLGSLSDVSYTTLRYGGDIAEILVYSDVLSDTEIDQVRQYLGAKWAVPEPSTFMLVLAMFAAGLGAGFRRRSRGT